MGSYDDIMNKQRYISPDRGGMSAGDRAAQFSAFAALTGFDGLIAESGRLTQPGCELDEGVKAAMDQVLQQLAQQLQEQPPVWLIWYRPDQRKAGGAYVSYRGRLKKMDSYHRMLIFTDGTRIPIDSLYHLEQLS